MYGHKWCSKNRVRLKLCLDIRIVPIPFSLCDRFSSFSINFFKQLFVGKSIVHISTLVQVLVLYTQRWRFVLVSSWRYQYKIASRHIFTHTLTSNLTWYECEFQTENNFPASRKSQWVDKCSRWLHKNSLMWSKNSCKRYEF